MSCAFKANDLEKCNKDFQLKLNFSILLSSFSIELCFQTSLDNLQVKLDISMKLNRGSRITSQIALSDSNFMP